jgi:outer membrane protein
MSSRLCFPIGSLLLVTALLVPEAPAQEAQKLTLRETVTLALQNSHDLALARVQYSIAEGQVAVGRAEFRPNLYTGFGAAYTSGFPATPGGNGPSIFNLSYTQSILNLPLSGQIRAAEERAANAKLEMDRMRDAVIVRAASVYLDLANVRHALELMRAEQASAEKILQVTQERANAGQELPMEVTRSELTVAQVQERILKLEGREQNLSEQIRLLTGIAEDQAIEVSSEEPSFSTEQQEAELLAMALKTNPGIQEAENERSARQHIFQGAKGGYWPTVSIIGEYEVLAKFNNYEEFYKMFQRNNVTLGIEAQIPIFSSRTRATVTLAKRQLEEAEILLGGKRDEVRRDVMQKVGNVRELDASREVARLELKLAQQTLEMTQAKFEDGRATLRDVEQARLDESDKWVAFLDADLARQEGQLSLLQATGQLAKVFQ